MERWDAIIAINLCSSFHTIRAALPGMKSAGWGRIINIASTHGLVASVNKCACIMAKHGIMGLTKTAALELAGTGVTCNAICPGWVLTPLVRKQIDAGGAGEDSDSAGRTRIADREQPSGKFTTVVQLGALAVFLCSPAGDNITGIPIAADGGWTAQ